MIFMKIDEKSTNFGVHQIDTNYIKLSVEIDMLDTLKISYGHA